MNKIIRKRKKVTGGMSYLLLLLFLFSCTLQISVTLKYSNLINIGSETKATKGLVYELPDTPENPEKNNFDYFEEDNNDETVKDFGFGHGYFLNQVANIYKAQLLLIKHYRNYMESHVVDHMYLSLRVMKI